MPLKKNRFLTEHLKNKFADSKNVTIIEGDVLKFSHAEYGIEDMRYKIVGNIPYYITSYLLRTIFEKWPAPELIVLMVQKEVAQRITAEPPHMSLLAISVQYYSEPKIVSYVSRGSFHPMPKVDSAITKLEIRKQKIEDRKYDDDFFRIVRAGFAGKRKQLVNNLVAHLKLPKREIESRLLSADIDPKRRAETLTIKEWQKIANIFS